MRRHRLHVYTWNLDRDPDTDPANYISTYASDQYADAYLAFLGELGSQKTESKLILVDLDDSGDSVMLEDSRREIET